ncbi:MAG: RNA polymerase sigma factor [Deltaproteobacteria bacterium]|nr:RNA polymerase sigma factor [Deltaproteobacteria bacterium]
MDNYRQFYEKHNARLFYYLLRMTGDYHLAGDIMQESFLRFFEHYRHIEEKTSLLYTIARNLVFDESRRKKPDKTGVIPENQSEDCLVESEHQVLIREEYRQMLGALQQLSSDDREVLALVAGGDCSYREIGRILDISESHVKVKVHRARLKLKTILNAGGD